MSVRPVLSHKKSDYFHMSLELLNQKGAKTEFSKNNLNKLQTTKV
jgi:hypothetical protein